MTEAKKRNRKVTEDALLMAAGKLFAQKGYENTRTLEIAKLAGANEALIGRYFGGKEGLLVALLKNEETFQHIFNQEDCSKLDSFPPKSECGDLQSGIRQFFKNGMKSIDLKEEFMRIGVSRALIDPEMAEVVRKRLIDQHTPNMVRGLQTYFPGKKFKKGELEALALLLLSANFNMNFQGRKVYQVDSRQINASLELIAESLSHFFNSKK